jgi:hypothetical protein
MMLRPNRHLPAQTRGTHCASGRQIVQQLLSVKARAPYVKSGRFRS